MDKLKFFIIPLVIVVFIFLPIIIDYQNCIYISLILKRLNIDKSTMYLAYYPFLGSIIAVLGTWYFTSESAKKQMAKIDKQLEQDKEISFRNANKHNIDTIYESIDIYLERLLYGGYLKSLSKGFKIDAQGIVGSELKKVRGYNDKLLGKLKDDFYYDKDYIELFDEALELNKTHEPITKVIDVYRKVRDEFFGYCYESNADNDISAEILNNNHENVRINHSISAFENVLKIFYFLTKEDNKLKYNIGSILSDSSDLKNLLELNKNIYLQDYFAFVNQFFIESCLKSKEITMDNVIYIVRKKDNLEESEIKEALEEFKFDSKSTFSECIYKNQSNIRKYGVVENDLNQYFKDADFFVKSVDEKIEFGLQANTIKNTTYVKQNKYI